MTALSHVSLVIGLGSSCSQPLLANRPSSTDGSFLKPISRFCAAFDVAVDVRLKPEDTSPEAAADTDTVRGANAVFGRTPSWSHLRQVVSNSAVGWLDPPVCRLQYSRTMSYG